MRKIEWSNRANADLYRLYGFLKPKSILAAVNAIEALESYISILQTLPRMGARQHRFNPREIRRLVADDYCVYYEIINEDIYIACIYHGKEDQTNISL